MARKIRLPIAALSRLNRSQNSWRGDFLDLGGHGTEGLDRRGIG